MLSTRALHGLKAYRYKSGGYTILDDMHNPLWCYLVECLPTWLAPNLITLLGALAIFCAYAANIYWNSNFQVESPTWVYLLSAASIIVYINLDCMDGKQARRTKSSSPLGQLFDHGVDALVLHMMLANIAASLGETCSWKVAAGCLGIMVPWMLAQWEEYHTGVMMYGTRYYGVLEANYCICLVHLVSAIWGLSLWQAQLPLPSSLLSLARSLLLSLSQSGPMLGPLSVWAASAAVPSSISVADAALLIVSSAGMAQGTHNVVRVLGPNPPKLPKEEVGHKALGRLAAATQMVILVGTTVLGAVTVALAGQGSQGGGSDMMGLEHLRLQLGLSKQAEDAAYCRLAFSSFGILYAFTASQLIIAHMAKEPLAPSFLALGCFAISVLNVLFQVASPSGLSLVLHTVALVGYLVFTCGVVRQICGYLGIKCFSIAKQKGS